MEAHCRRGSLGCDLRPARSPADSIGKRQYKTVGQGVGRVKPAKHNHAIVRAVVHGGLPGATAGSRPRRRQLRPRRSSTRTIGVGENPDISKTRGPGVTTIDSHHVVRSIVDGAGTLPRRRRSAARRELLPRRAAASAVRVAQDPHVIEISGGTIVPAKHNQGIRIRVVHSRVMQSGGRCCTGGRNRKPRSRSPHTVGTIENPNVVHARTGRSRATAENGHAVAARVVGSHVPEPARWHRAAGNQTRRGHKLRSAGTDQPHVIQI